MADLSCSATMANPNRKRGRPRLFTTPEKKKKFYKMLGRCVFLGDTFVEWRNLRELGMNRDSELARVLLDSFQATGQPTAINSVPSSSSPQATWQPPRFDDVSSVSGHSESVTAFISQPLFNEPGNEKESNVLENNQEDLTISCIEPELQSVESREDLTLSCIEPELQSVESSISHLLVNDPDNEKEINALENTQTTSTLLGRDVENGVITPGEEVFDHDMQGGEEDDDDNIEFPDEVKVNHSRDIKVEQCFIVYKKTLL
ncbi:uncharacterized protein LOC130385960 [Gadus chalcogrammus]|uniref:uncharacterized protein LOC130385960 n=1 Tax=Gadus chalcogrammus TaxID=1042646 RepID=UPI0024C33667|nr:uncharacterized protein LOC130385960 [Gadus chalcogrammus]